MELYKGKGNPSQPSSYREVLLTDSSSKPFMSSSRNRMKGYLNDFVHESQFGGGCNTGSTAVCHLNARAQVDLALSSGQCVIQLYIDVRTAFAAMLRALAVPCNTSDAVFFERLTQFGFSKNEVLQLFDEVQSPDRFTDLYGSAHMAQVVNAFCNASWMSFETLPGVMCPKSGTMAGTSWADVMFLGAFAKVLEHFECMCTAAGLGHTVPTPRISDYF
eukprot:5851918-Karenia_brevis.AAC.1